MLYGEKSVCLQKRKHTLNNMLPDWPVKSFNAGISGGGLCHRHGGDLFRGHHGHGRDRRDRLRCR